MIEGEAMIWCLIRTGRPARCRMVQSEIWNRSCAQRIRLKELYCCESKSKAHLMKSPVTASNLIV